MLQYIMLFIFHITDAIMSWTNALASSRNQALLLFPVVLNMCGNPITIPTEADVMVSYPKSLNWNAVY